MMSSGKTFSPSLYEKVSPDTQTINATPIARSQSDHAT